ncbi:MAG: hypothetical protein F7C33_06485 [Desulfurococcales archaeon]|nr:hypothetical protein [Desulfurococcales archaeon]
MEIQLEDMKSILRIYPAIIVAVSDNLAVASVLGGGVSVPPRVAKALTAYLRGDESSAERLEVWDKILLYSIAYGGLTLHFIDNNDSIPLARIVTLEKSLKAKKEAGDCEPHKLDDKSLLRAWSLIYKGREQEGLSALGECSVYPEHVALEVVDEPGIPLGYETRPL